MRLKLKIISLMMAWIYIFASVCSLGADSIAEHETQSHIKLMNELGLLPDGFEYNSSLQKEMKRGDFASLVVEFSGINKSGVAVDDNMFSDVKATDDNYNSIMLACKYGYMSGTGEGKFSPDSKVTYHQVVKVMTVILGYDEVALATGGYPYGYLSQASKLGLLQNVSPMDDSTRISGESIITIMYNMLDAKVLRYIGMSGDSAMLSSDDDDTFLKIAHKISRHEGVLQGVRGMTALSGQAPSANEIIINSMLYKLGIDANYSALFGYEVEYYLNDDGKVIAISTAHSSSYSIDIKFDDIHSLSYNGIEYYDQSDRKINTVFSSDTDFVCNGIVKHIDSFADVLASDGRLTLVFTDSDRTADVVIVTTVKNYVVKKADQTNMIIYDMYSSDKFDAEEYDEIEFKNEFGEEVYFFELDEYDVVSVVEYADKSYAALYYSNTEAEGTIDSINKGTPSYITIDGKDWRVASSFESQLSSMKTGDYGIFVLDIYGSIASFGARSGKYEYGYLASGYVRTGVDSKVVVKLLTERGELETLDVSDKIILDGRTCKSEDAKNVLCTPQLIRYYKSSGKLKVIDTLLSDCGGSADSLVTMFEGYSDEYKSVTSLRWNSYQKIFGMKIAVDDTAKVFYVPRKYSDNENDYAVKTNKVFSHDQNYYINAYTAQDDSCMANVIIMYGLKSSGSVTKNTPFTMVEKITPTLNENGEKTYKLYGVRNGQHVSNIIEDASIVDGLMSINPDTSNKVHQLKCGDIVKVNVNSEDVITQIVLHYEYDSNTLKENTTVATDDTKATRTLTANVYSSKGGILQITQNPLNSSGITPADNEIEVINGSKYEVYQYRNENGREYAEIVSVNEIIDYKCSETGFSQIVVCGQYSNPGIIVIR